MAIPHLRAKVVSRSSGRSSVAAAAYRSGELLIDERIGLSHDYTRRDGVVHAEIIAPDRQPVDRQQLWAAVEKAETRKDAQTARELEIALPVELDAAERKALALEFASHIADRYGVAVDVAIHLPSKTGDDRNHHAHLLCTTRQVSRTESGEIALDPKKHREMNSKETLADLRETWQNMANQHLEQAGQSARISMQSYKDQGIDLTPTKHLGPAVVAMARRGEPTERMAEHEAIRQQQRLEILAKPSIITDKLTQMKATFTARDVAKELNRYIDDREEFQGLMAKVMYGRDVVKLQAPDGKTCYTTREMQKVEQGMIANAKSMSGSTDHRVSPSSVDRAIKEAGTMSQEQAAAVRHVTGSNRLAVIIGDAGTGKSFSMRTAAKAWEAAGYNVRGAALAGKAADELQAGSGINSRTLASLEYAWSKGKDKLTSKDVLVIDEAGMVGSRQMSRVLAEAEKAGAKVVLLGDHKQLAAIEAGASFRAITERVGAAEITQVRRQSVEWQKEAGQQLARGSVQDAIKAYQAHGNVHATESKEAAIAALAHKYVADRTENPEKSQIVLAHTNKDVQALNQAIREERKTRGDLAGEVTVETEKGEREFAAGDRVVFLKNDRDVGVKNGTLGTIEKATATSMDVRLDDGTKRTVDLNTYNNIDHGYAVTVHKAQGVTVDKGYVLATPTMDRALGYVAMTRHREAAELYHSTEDFKDVNALAKSMERVDTKTSTLDFREVQHGRGIGRGIGRDDGRDQARDASREAGRAGIAESVAVPVSNGINGVDLLRELPARDLAAEEQGREPGMVLADAPASRQQREEGREHHLVPGQEAVGDPASGPARGITEPDILAADIAAGMAQLEEQAQQHQPAREKSATEMSDEEFAAELDVEPEPAERHAPESRRSDDLDRGATHIAPPSGTVQEREPEQQQTVPIYLTVPKNADRDVHVAIRETGQAAWDRDARAWQVVDPANMDKLAEWLPTEHQAEAQRQAAERAPLYAEPEQARQEREQAAREAAEAQARRDHERKAVDAVGKRAELIDRAQTVVIQERKEELAQATEAAQKSLDDMGKRPGTVLGMGKAKQEAWDKDRLARERVLEQAKDAEHKWFHYPDKKWAREQAAVRVDKANPELAALARDGEQIRQREEQQKRAQQQERVQENLQKIRQRKERERENDRGGRSR